MHIMHLTYACMRRTIAPSLLRSCGFTKGKMKEDNLMKKVLALALALMMILTLSLIHIFVRVSE